MLMAFMRTFKEETNASNAALNENINKKIETLDKKLDKNIEKLSDKIVNMEEKIVNIDESMENLRLKTDGNRIETDKVNKRMLERINDIEKEMFKSKEIRKRTMDLRRREEDLTSLSAGRSEEARGMSFSSDWAKKLEAEEQRNNGRECVERINAEKIPNKRVEEAQVPSSWIERGREVPRTSDHDWFEGDKEKSKSVVGVEATNAPAVEISLKEKEVSRRTNE